jgi:hypothetical protein
MQESEPSNSHYEVPNTQSSSNFQTDEQHDQLRHAKTTNLENVGKKMKP